MIEIDGALVDAKQIWSLTKIQLDSTTNQYIFNVMVNNGTVTVTRPTLEEAEQERERIVQSKERKDYIISPTEVLLG